MSKRKRKLREIRKRVISVLIFAAAKRYYQKMSEPERSVVIKGASGPFFKNKHYERTFLLFIIFTIALLSIGAFSYADQTNRNNQGQTECQPTYGNYLPSERWGWYGARREVKTPIEALEIIEKVIVIHHKGIKVGKIREGVRFYMAEIVNTKGQILDVIIIDRQTGRLRTAY